MGIKAVDKIEDAAKKTRELLLPFKTVFWAKLTFITLLTGSGFGTALFQLPLTPSTQISHGMFNIPTVSTGLIFTFAGIVTLLTLILILVNSIAEFVLFRTILSKEANIRRYFTENLSRGLRYLAYRISILTFVFGTAITTVLILSINPFLGLVSLLFILPVFLLLILFDMLIRDFIIPEMLEQEKTLTASTKSIYEEFRPQWIEVMAYLVVRLVLTAAVGVSVTTAAGFIVLIFALPGFLFFLLIDLSLIFILPLLALMIILVSVLAAVSMPFQVYLYSYKLEVYSSLRE